MFDSSINNLIIINGGLPTSIGNSFVFLGWLNMNTMTLKVKVTKSFSMVFISMYVPLSNLFLFEQYSDDDLQKMNIHSTLKEEKKTIILILFDNTKEKKRDGFPFDNN